MLIEKVLNTLPKIPVPVRDIVSGLHWTAVTSLHCGLASSLWSESLAEVPFPDLAQLKKLSAQELAEFALSSNHLESAMGMAAINSLLDPTPPGSFDLNAHDWLIQKGAGKKIAMIGHFPFAEKLAPVAQELWILEKKPRPGDLPASKSKEMIPQADIVAITGSAFVNHSIDEVISYCSPKSQVLVLGPSTPMAPVLFSEGITMLSGAYVIDEAGTIEAIRKGGTYHHLLGVRRITLLKQEINQ